MSPSLKNLQYLIELHKAQHFTKAAKASFVSPSTLSAGIVKLEQDLQVQLVERDNKHVSFTLVGEDIVKRAISIISEVNDLTESAKINFFESELSIGVIPTISTYLLPKFLSNIESIHPQLKVIFKEDTSNNLIKLLEQAKIDFAIFALPYEMPDFIESYKIFEDSICFIGHKDSYNSPIRDKSLLLLEEGHCLRSHILQSNSISSNQVSEYSCSSISTLVAMVNMKVGVSFIPKMALEFGVLRQYDNIITDSRCDKVKRDIGVIYRKNSAHKENIQKLAKLLISSFKAGFNKFI